MTVIASIVEGHGEVSTLPVLLRRLSTLNASIPVPSVLKPIRVPRDKFISKEEEFRRYLLLAAQKCGPEGWILVLLDADFDCPATLGNELLERAKEIVPGGKISVVLANEEFEAWFVASAVSLQGQRRFAMRMGDDSIDAEAVGDAKAWVRDRMAGSYGETTDQPALTAVMDLALVETRSRSFRKLCTEWRKHVAGEEGEQVIT